MNAEYIKKLRYSAMDIYKDIESFAGTFEIPLSEAIEIYKIAVLSDIKSEIHGVQSSIDALD